MLFNRPCQGYKLLVLCIILIASILAGCGPNPADLAGVDYTPESAGDYRYNLAWGHGGQQIALLDDLDMLVVVTVDPLHGQHGDGPWKIEKANLNLVADFVASLPGE